MRSIYRSLASMLTGAGMLLGAAGAIGAESEYGGPQADRFYISPGVTYYSYEDDLGLENEDTGPAVILGYGLSDRWFTELMYSRLDPKIELPGAGGEADVDLYWLNFGFKLEPMGGWQPFVTAGGGRTDTDYKGAAGDFDDTQFNAGFGIFRQLDERFSVRADVRGVHSAREEGFEPFAFLGLNAVIGSVSRPAPADTDGDGVPDADDRCPGTPAGRDVDATGCERDADNDGVVDGDDACPNTPSEATVDERGCPLDGDGDGVPDYLDECPDSEAGARVDEKGCYIELTETVTMDLNLEFDLESAELRPEHFTDIQRVVGFLREYPTADAVIEGHTDSSGSDAFNQRLSEERAKAVYDYLVEEGGISRQRLRFVGHGESRPTASNETAEGRQANRRVSAVISAQETVRAE